MADFMPNDFETTLFDGDTKLRLAFQRDDGESREIVIEREWLPLLVAQLVSKIEQGQAVPIGQQGLPIGRTFQTTGWSVQKNTDGRRRLILVVDLPDESRQVTIPLELSAADAQSLKQQLA